MTLPAFVLVHGAWGEVWIWHRILATLRAAGHEVQAVTLTGDGERAHLRRRDIDLQTQIADVLDFIDAEEMDGVVLVGHSYGGQVIACVADGLLARRAGAVRQLLYLDAMVPQPSEDCGQQHDPAVVAARTTPAAANDHALPPHDQMDFGPTSANRDWLLRSQVPHPLGPYRNPLDFDLAHWLGHREFNGPVRGPRPALDGLKCLDTTHVPSNRAAPAVPWTVHQGRWLSSPQG